MESTSGSYVQMHEFEGILFSDTSALAYALDRDDLVEALSTIRALFSSPEDINEGKETAPSKRIYALVPGYQKPFHGSLAAVTISLGRIRQACPLFDAWLRYLEALGTPPSNAVTTHHDDD